ncbi:MAG: DPP IV N-terminal domain-containing protein [Bacteroidales bacterium]
MLVSQFGLTQKNLSIEDAVLGMYRGLSPKNLSNLEWMHDNEHFSYVKDYQYLVKVSVEDLSETILLNIIDLNENLELQEQVKFDYLSDYKWIDENTVLIFNSRTYAVIDIFVKNKEKYLFILPDNAVNPDYSAEANKIAYTIDGKLYMMDHEGTQKLIAGSDIDGWVFGEYVSRREFGINKGTFWSPGGDKIAFYRKDEREVSLYPVVNIENRIAGLENLRYPMAGEASEHVALGVYDLNTGKTIYIEEDTISEKYLTNITWSPDGQYIFIAVLNRGQDHLMLNRYKVQSGSYDKTLFEERDERYVEPEHGPLFFEGLDDHFVWFSERDGYNHLYLYDMEGNLVRQLTKGEWIVKKVNGFNPEQKIIFAETTIKSSLENHLTGIDTREEGINILSEEEGFHQGTVSPDGNYIIDNYQSTGVPRKIFLMNHKGRKLETLLVAEDPLKEYRLADMEIFRMKADDRKTDLYGRIIKPVDYDKNKKYPVILHVYGGPHNQMITRDWLGGAGLWDYYMAQEGYIMLTIDNRGSANRGFDFESVIHKQLGKIEMLDQMKGVEYLLENVPYADSSRIGVYGWSYGGFMTINMMLNYPEIFKTGVAGGPVTDWKFYEVMYGERYMDTPEENPEGYESSNLNLKAGNLKGRLLIIHGAIDPTVVWQNSLVFLNNAINEGVLLDYFVYPRHEHNVVGYDRIHLRKKTVQYFNDFLK